MIDLNFQRTIFRTFIPRTRETAVQQLKFLKPTCVVFNIPKKSDEIKSTRMSSIVGLNEVFPDIFQYAVDSKWRKIKKLLRVQPELIRARSSSGMNFLSCCIAHEAPIRLLSLINKKEPGQILQKDDFGSNVCHIACIYCVSFKIMKWILAKHSVLISSTDVDSRLPIHHLADSLCRDEIEAKEAIEIMNIMINVNPEILFLGDRNGNTVIDQLQLDIGYYKKNKEKHTSKLRNLKHVCAFLREKSIETWLKKKKRWENTPYVKLKTPLQQPFELASLV